MADLSFEDMQKARNAVSARLDRAMEAKRKDWARIGELYAALQTLDAAISADLKRWED